jgi:3-deoxy-D-arabino-heptulosonate 7-phosphate (DAHP) synthase
VHPDPTQALSDAAAQLRIEEAVAVLRQVTAVRAAAEAFCA